MSDEATARFVEAHKALLADPSIQFDLRRAPPPSVPPKLPEWLIAFGHWLARVFKPVGRFLAWLGSLLPDAPYGRILMWTVLAVAAVLLGRLLLVRHREGVWRWPRWRRSALFVESEPEPEWTPDFGTARALLAEADALAAGGHYAEAAHLLLLRSVDEIERFRPRLVRPALTARDLAATDAIPAQARGLFAGIAGLVERSLFGGRSVNSSEWQGARAAYSDFALAGSWRR